MVTLKNTGGVELDMDSIMSNMINCQEPQTDGGGGGNGTPDRGHAKAVLIPGKTSHPFQERTLTLDQTVKIGRSVARIRPSATNGIFDCKVLSRNHAIIWYDNKKFYIQDTKSSNGTFVNNHRLSKGSEDSLPREIYSGDVVQFGVDVLENQRKGNEDTENSDESNHIVTHGCIVATIKLYYPNGKEADSSQVCSVPKSLTSLSQEEICNLQLIIYEAQQREVRLHDKLEELQFIVNKLEFACQDALTNRFEETRLLSKIENLEKQTRIMRKIRQGSIDKSSEKAEMEIHQLLLDVEKVQCASREIQEMHHRKLLETEQKLAEAQTAASNLQLEVYSLREHASRSETHVQELAAKCTAFTQTIELLKTNLTVQMEANHELEARMAAIQQREEEFRNNFYKQTKLRKIGLYKGKLITEESEEDEDASKKEKDNEEFVLEWISRYFNETASLDQKDRINEDDRMESLKKQIDNLREALSTGLQNISTCLGQLDSARLELEKSKEELKKCLIRKEELIWELQLTKLVPDENDKTENDVYSEKNEKHEVGKTIILSLVNNEKMTELENELKEQEEHNYMLECSLEFYKCMVALAKDLLQEARQKNEECERKYDKLKCKLDAAKFNCDILNIESYNLRKTLENRYGCLELPTDFISQKMAKFDSEKVSKEEKKLAVTQGAKEGITDNKECQTVSIVLKSAETNTEDEGGAELSEEEEEESKIIKELNGSANKDEEEPEADNRVSTGYTEISEVKDSVDGEVTSEGESPENKPADGNGEDSAVPTEAGDHSLVKSASEIELSPSNLGIWEKIERVQNLSNGLPSGSSSVADFHVKEIRNLLNLIAEDLVRLLLQKQQMNKDRQNLQERLDKSMTQTDIASLGLAMDVKTITLFAVTAIISYFLLKLLF